MHQEHTFRVNMENFHGVTTSILYIKNVSFLEKKIKRVVIDLI